MPLRREPKSVEIIEQSSFEKAIDPRIEGKCINCPPDEHPEEYYCACEFSIL